jgi:hypothetical protein
MYILVINLLMTRMENKKYPPPIFVRIFDPSKIGSDES